jgi:menaquinone-9 beta-reductase
MAAETAQAALAANDFSAGFLKQYDKTLFRKIEKEIRISYWLQRLTFYPRIFRRLLDKAAGNPVMQDTLYNMFTDVNLRDKLRSPLFYWRLIKD